MTTFLVRESLNYAEFVEALVRLAEEKQGIRPEDQDFGLPDEWSDWADDDSQEWQWRRWQQDEGLGHAEAEPQEFDRDAEEADAEEATRRNPQAESGSPGGAYQRVPDATPSRRSQAVQPSQTADPINEMSFADSFVLVSFVAIDSCSQPASRPTSGGISSALREDLWSLRLWQKLLRPCGMSNFWVVVMVCHHT